MVSNHSKHTAYGEKNVKKKDLLYQDREKEFLLIHAPLANQRVAMLIPDIIKRSRVEVLQRHKKPIL